MVRPYTVDNVVVTAEEISIFYSYGRPVAIETEDMMKVDARFCFYSRTTSKYLYKYLDEYTIFAGFRKEDILKAIKTGVIKDGPIKIKIAVL